MGDGGAAWDAVWGGFWVFLLTGVVGLFMRGRAR